MLGRYGQRVGPRRDGGRPTAATAAPVRVLVIDDDLRLWVRLLRLRPSRLWQWRWARSGETGLALARATVPDVVVVRLDLPDRDGWEICRGLRTDPATMGVPIVMSRVPGSETCRPRGVRVCADVVVPRPFTTADLVRAVRRAKRWRTRWDRQGVRAEVRFEFDSRSESLFEADQILETLSRSVRLGPGRLTRLRQAFLEIASNAIEWGNRLVPSRLVAGVMRIYDDRLELSVRDQGEGFDPDDLPHACDGIDPLAHLERRERMGLREGGFGLLIARRLVDELRHGDGGSEATLVMRLDTEAPA
ncbi:MAG: hypothetical protein KatS3mg108_3701 [Isosphaeraceae bacterium]|nr:MAG: hypothetical protein KatS3mg108_3701 [Isosphaeraceae bacterium]